MKEPHEIIDQLSPEDALVVLKTLARDDERLAARIAEITTTHLGTVDPEEVAFGLYEELEFLEVEEVWVGRVQRATATWTQAKPPTRWLTRS
jgi:broad specificity phosphatase PhoE